MLLRNCTTCVDDKRVMLASEKVDKLDETLVPQYRVTRPTTSEV
jgi:hypothetical protein